MALFFAFVAAALAAVVLRVAGVHLDPVAGVVAFGLAIVACAFLMGTAAELAQLDINENLALVVVALLAVLPEYAVDVYLVYRAGEDPHYTALAMANMTGANRLLIGVGWPVIAFLWWWKSRQKVIQLEPAHGGAVFFLAIATLYSFVIPFKGSLSLFDTAALLVVFLLYLRFAKAQPHEDVELVGPAETIARLPTRARRITTLLVFLVSGAGIFAASEPFAESLIACGRQLGVDEYYLIQWLAPLASESPEFLVASLLVLRMNPNGGFGTLLSSKLNQWTLLVGALPLAFIISRHMHGGALEPMPIDERQFGEVLLTAAQSYLGVCVLLNLRFSVGEAAWMFLLFIGQLVASLVIEHRGGPELAHWMQAEKWVFSGIYIVVGTAHLIAYRKHIGPAMRGALYPRSALHGRSHPET